MEKPQILISSCILGNNVRYDGANKLDTWVATKLSQYFILKGVCPEMQMGLGVPREPVNLVQKSAGDIRMISLKTKIDHTENALQVSKSIIQNDLENVSGAILQKKSPSCGVERVKLYNENNDVMLTSKTNPNRGIFAKTLLENCPMLPIIDSGRLFDDNEKENFLRRVVCYHRFHLLDGKIKSLQDFHARYKFVIMEHSQEAMRQLGNIAANSKNTPADEVYKVYSQLLFLTMQKIPTSKSRTNVYFHLIGFFKNELEKTEKEIIHQMITDYNKGILPYVVPLKMLEFLISKHQQYYLKNHYFLDQFPKELRAN